MSMAADIEIYKALECCVSGKCGDCYYKKYSTYGCKEVMLKDTMHNFGRLMREVKEAKDGK